MTHMKALFLCILYLLPRVCLHAQTGQGVVTGTVLDSSGAIIAGASVQITNDGTNITQTQKSAADGSYRFLFVPPGTYSLTVDAPGFSQKLQKGLLVRPSQTLPFNVTLSVSEVSTTIEVTGASPLVQTATSDLTQTVDKSTLESTALLTRNIYDLVFVAPQVSLGMDFNAAPGGVRESGVGFMLNGAENNDNFSEGYANVIPAQETVSEFTILTNIMSAQYGRAAGAVVSAVQKSGTNQFHGVLYEFNRNTVLNASDFFANRTASPKPAYNRNQFGGQIDGPIIKDKTFFAFGLDRLTLAEGITINQPAPTSSEVAAMSAGAGPIARTIMAKFPTLVPTTLCAGQQDNYPDSLGHMGCAQIPDPLQTRQNTWFAKVDHNFSSKDRLSFTLNLPRYIYTDKYGGGYPSTNPISLIDAENYHNISLVETHTFGPQMLNELTVAHNRHYSVQAEGDGSIREPMILIAGDGYGGLGFGYGAYNGLLMASFVQDRWQFQDNFAWNVGKHSLKIGGGWMWGTLYRNFDAGLPGYYSFANTMGPTPDSFGIVRPDGSLSDPDGVVDITNTNFQHDFPNGQGLAIDTHTGKQANAYRHYVMNDLNAFVQDDWKIGPRLSLNLGLRWERYGAPREVNGILSMFTNLNCLTPDCIAAARIGPVDNMWNTRNGDFGPRVGFAWDVFGDSRTALRAGFGISYDRIFDNVWSNGAWNPPFYGLAGWNLTAGDSIYYASPPKPSPSYVPDSLPGAAGRVNVRTMENNLKDSSVQNYFLGIEHLFSHDYLLRVNYQGSMGRHLPVNMNLNRYDGMGYNPRLTLTRPNSLYTGFNYRANSLSSNYNAMVIEVQKSLRGGLRFQAGYTFSKLIDCGSDVFAGGSQQGQYSQPDYFISNSQVHLEKGRGAFDHTHSFKLNASYSLPIFRSQSGFVGKTLGGWQLSGFLQFYSGHPLEIYNSRLRFKGNARDSNGVPENIGGDYNLDSVTNDRPVLVGNAANAYAANLSPADGIFTDNNLIGCGYAGANSTNIAACNDAYGVSSPNTLFANPPGNGVRFGTLGRNVFIAPSYIVLDTALIKDVKITESIKLQFRFEGLNLPNHPNFDFIDTDLNSGTFGEAQGLAGAAPSRRIQIGVRLMF